MIKKIVTNSQLDEALQNLITHSNFYYPQVQDYFMDMYITGCRPTELLLPELWQDVGPGFRLQTLKTGTVRLIDAELLSNEFTNAIVNNERPYAGLTHYQIEAEYKRHFKLSELMCGKKMVQMYSFRYNRARIACNELTDLSIVMEVMGWKNPEIAKGYITNTLNLK